MKTLRELSEFLRERRRSLGLSQKDMFMRIGMTQQQYQRIESAGDLRVTTLFRVLEGMGLELTLVSRDSKQILAQQQGKEKGQEREPGVAEGESQSWSKLPDHLAGDES